jgi:hypothetical protein
MNNGSWWHSCIGCSSPTAPGLLTPSSRNSAAWSINSLVPEILPFTPLVAKVKEIREVINVKAGVSDADVLDFFMDEEVVGPVESAAVEVQLEEEPPGEQPGKLPSPPPLAVVSTVPSSPPSVLVGWCD